MTTDVEALIADLEKELYGPASWGDTVLMSRAIDAPRSQAEHIQILESSNGHLRDALRAQSDKIQSMALSAISDAERIQALEAKCALLAASLAQEEEKCAELEKEARRYRWSIALEDNAEELYAAVISCGPKAPESIGIEIDAHIAAQTRSKDGE